MSCEIGNNSPFDDSMLDDDWAKSPTGGLEAISEFNANFDAQNSSNTIDPQLTFSNPSTSQPNNNTFHFNTNTTTATNGLDQTISPEPNSYESYPPPFTHEPPSSPYYQSVELNAGPAYHPSPLRNEHYTHRRSVSEPPAEMAPAMMFHRENHFLGTPMRQPKAMPLKSLPKNRAQRNHPYAAAAARKSNQAHPMEQSPAPPPGYRPNMHRSQTQPVRGHPPTSAPMQMPPYQFPPQHPHPHQHPHSPRRPRPYPHPQMQMMPEQHFAPVSTSRICTPAPEAVMMSPSAIDPALSQPSTPMRLEQRQTVSISLTVDELRSMIFDAVQNAVGTAGGKKKVGEGVECGSPQEVDFHQGEAEGTSVQKVDEYELD